MTIAEYLNFKKYLVCFISTTFLLHIELTLKFPIRVLHFLFFWSAASANANLIKSLTPEPGKWQSYIWYNFERNYSFCGVAKVASSTWRSHNRDLVGHERFDAYLQVLVWTSCSWHQSTKQPILYSPIFSTNFSQFEKLKKITNFLLVQKRFFVNFGPMRSLFSFSAAQTTQNSWK